MHTTFQNYKCTARGQCIRYLRPVAAHHQLSRNLKISQFLKRLDHFAVQKKLSSRKPAPSAPFVALHSGTACRNKLQPVRLFKAQSDLTLYGAEIHFLFSLCNSLTFSVYNYCEIQPGYSWQIKFSGYNFLSKDITGIGIRIFCGSSGRYNPVSVVMELVPVS